MARSPYPLQWPDRRGDFLAADIRAGRWRKEQGR